MANATLQSFTRKVTEAWPRKQDADAKAHLIKVAQDGHEKIMRDQRARAGYAPDWNAYANRPGNAVSAVVLPGPIVFTYRYGREVVDQIVRALRAASPVDSGDYVRGHTIYVNGQPVDRLPAVVKRSDEVMIANPVPYARRIEIGKTKSGRPFVLQVPDRVYERVAKGAVARRYSQVAKLRFGYVDLGAGAAKGKLSATYGYKGKGGVVSQRKRRQKAGAAIRSPAIFIESFS